MEEEVRLLILEPEEHLRLVLEEQFLEQGFSVTTVNTGDAALNLLKSETFAGFITESRYQGEVKSVIELLTVLAHGPAALPIVIITTSDQSFEVDEAFRRYVDAVFYKPYESITLEELLKSAVLPRIMALCNRQYTRVEARLPIKCTDPGTGVVVDGISHNVAQGGMSVVIEHGSAPPIGNRMNFMIFPPRSAPVEGVAMVVWQRAMGPARNRQGFGLQFLQEESDMRRLSRLINELKTVRYIED